MTQFSAIITPQSVSFTTPDGKVHNVTESHKNWLAIRDAVKQIQASMKWDAENAVAIFRDNAINPHGAPEDCHESLAELVAAPTRKIIEAGAGRVTVVAGVVYYEEEPVNSAVTERILQGLSEGFDMTAYMLFLDNAMENPSARAVDEMYSFMEKNNMGITADGYILGYKKVKENFRDIYSGKFDNSPGEIVQMKRNKVDDDGRRTCSKGLHFCSMSYLPHYGCGPGDKIVIVKVNPRDIVSVPIDYDHAKVRCCEYQVLAEYTGDDKEDLLGTKAVWSDDDFDADDDDDVMEWESDELVDDDVEDMSDELEDMAEEEACSVEAIVPETGPEAALRAAREAMEFKRLAQEREYEHRAERAALIAKAADALVPDNSALSTFDIARYYKGNENAVADEVPPAFLSGEGEDMRQIMDTVETPHTEDGEVMRHLIDVVEEGSEAPDPLAYEPANISPATEDAVREAFARLVAEISKAAKKD
jgi:hypothetical protein